MLRKVSRSILADLAHALAPYGGVLSPTSGLGNACFARALCCDGEFDEKAAMARDTRIRTMQRLTPFELVPVDYCAAIARDMKLFLVLLSPVSENDVVFYLMVGDPAHALRCVVFFRSHFTKLSLPPAVVEALLCDKQPTLLSDPDEAASCAASTLMLFKDLWREEDAEEAASLVLGATLSLEDKAGGGGVSAPLLGGLGPQELAAAAAASDEGGWETVVHHHTSLVAGGGAAATAQHSKQRRPPPRCREGRGGGRCHGGARGGARDCARAVPRRAVPPRRDAALGEGRAPRPPAP